MMSFGIWDTTRDKWYMMTWHKGWVPMVFARRETAEMLVPDLGAGFEIRQYESEEK